MKTKLLKEDWKSWCPPLPISYKHDATIRKTSTDKSEYLKVYINTQPVERDSEMVAIYVPLFRTGSPKALLNFVTILHKIIRGQYLSTGPQKFVMTHNLVVG